MRGEVEKFTHPLTGGEARRYRLPECLVRGTEVWPALQLRQQAIPSLGQALEQREQPWAVHLLAQPARRRLFEVVRLIDHQVIELWKQATPDLGVGEQQGMVDDDKVRRLGL